MLVLIPTPVFCKSVGISTNILWCTIICYTLEKSFCIWRTSLSNLHCNTDALRICLYMYACPAAITLPPPPPPSLPPSPPPPSLPVCAVAVKGYPVIDGVVTTNRLTFARFFTSNGCSYRSYAVGNNPLSPDAVHPMVMAATFKLSVDLTSLVYFYEPNVEWIVQEVSE